MIQLCTFSPLDPPTPPLAAVFWSRFHTDTLFSSARCLSSPERK